MKCRRFYHPEVCKESTEMNEDINGSEANDSPTVIETWNKGVRFYTPALSCSWCMLTNINLNHILNKNKTIQRLKN